MFFLKNIDNTMFIFTLLKTLTDLIFHFFDHRQHSLIFEILHLSFLQCFALYAIQILGNSIILHFFIQIM